MKNLFFSKRFERVDDDDKKEYYRKNSPITYVSEDDPPILLIHGTEDKIVPFQQSEILISILGDKGVLNKLIVVEGFGHGFGFRNMEAFDYNEVLNWFNNHLLK